MSIKHEIVEANELKLVANEHGDPTGPAVLLTHGFNHWVIKKAGGKLPD